VTATTQEAIEVPALTYQTLDEVSGRALEYLLALWLLRPTMPEAEWIETFVNALVQVLTQAEGIGRAYGAVAVPVDGDPVFPEVPSKPYRPVPEDFEQRSGIAPKADRTITEDRVREIRSEVEKAVKTLAAEIERPTRVSNTLEDEVAEEPVNTERVERMVRDETVAQIQRGVQDGIRLSGAAHGYRRGINPDACELCFWLWKEGYVYPIDQPMHRHIGCRCVPVPTNDRIGRHARDEKDETGQRLLDRYYSDTLRETSFRKDTEA